ncbi:MAG: hypothetical protein CVU84_13480 [Firmicutes bacterium HGW-Firmicutes-1]|jgi:hypothetical protein|nr:MAG: hypothetical protein CVU84_13480 [Firmicutes bacterium HGW-Firmicutes-1]
MKKLKCIVFIMIGIVILSSSIFATKVSEWKKHSDKKFFDYHNNSVLVEIKDGNKQYYTYGDDGALINVDAAIIKSNYKDKDYNFTVLNDEKGLIGIETSDDSKYTKTNKKLNRFLLVDNVTNEIFEINPKSLEVTSLIEPSINGVEKTDFDNSIEDKKNIALYWAINPLINEEGNYMIYWSNKYLDKGKAKIRPGIWLYSFENNKEERIDTSVSDEEGIGPNSFYWLDNKTLVYDTVTINGDIEYYIYSISDNSCKLLRTFPSSVNVYYENGFLVYNDGSNGITLNYYNIKNDTESSYLFEKQVNSINPSLIKVSDVGKLAYPVDGNSILIIDTTTGSTIEIEAPIKAELIKVNQWIDNNKISIYLMTDVYDQSSGSTYVINVEETTN